MKSQELFGCRSDFIIGAFRNASLATNFKRSSINTLRVGQYLELKARKIPRGICSVSSEHFYMRSNPSRTMVATQSFSLCYVLLRQRQSKILVCHWTTTTLLNYCLENLEFPASLGDGPRQASMILWCLDQANPLPFQVGLQRFSAETSTVHSTRLSPPRTEANEPKHYNTILIVISRNE